MRKIRICLERHRDSGRRLTYYAIRDQDGCMIWCMRPECYYRLKAAIKRFDEFLEKIMKPIKKEDPTRVLELGALMGIALMEDKKRK